MRKLPVASLTFVLTFLILFFYFYKTSKKFRRSISNALIVTFVVLSSAFESSASESDAFSPPTTSRPVKSRGYFSTPSGSDEPDKPDKDDPNGEEEGIPQYPKTEPLDTTRERVEQMKIQNDKLKAMESESESEDECEIILVEINELFSSNAVSRLVNRSLKNNKVKKEYDRIMVKLEAGIQPLDIGAKSSKLRSDKILIKARYGRYFIQTTGSEINVLGIGDRANNMKEFEALMNKMYDVDLQY